MNRPLVSVGIPTFSRPEELRKALECICRQEYSQLEIIVGDNASPGPATEACSQLHGKRQESMLLQTRSEHGSCV